MHPSFRVTTAAVVALGTSAVLTAVPLTAVAQPSTATPSAHAAPRAHDVALAPDTGSTARGANAVLSARADVDGLATAGITWREGAAPQSVEVRTRTGAGWSPWEQVDTEDGGRPGSRGGTEPIVLGRVDEVEVRLRTAGGAAVQDPVLTVIDPGTVALASSAAAAPQTMSATASDPGVPPQPEILPRSAWGADESNMTWAPGQGAVTAGVVHHTAGTNDYAPEDVPAILRGIYEYHADTRDWGDIGYNFFVDKYGRIWEGRSGGIRHATPGAHAVGYNSLSTGVSVLGDYTATAPSQASFDAVASLLAWKLSLHGARADSTVVLNGSPLPAVLGHRDLPGAATACPGTMLWNRLTELRTAVTALQDAAGPVPADAWSWNATGWGYRVIPAAVVYTSPRGTFVVPDAFTGTLHRQRGGGTGVLGYPVGKYVPQAVGYGYQQFERGIVYYGPAGAHDVRSGPIATVHGATGGGGGTLGYPVADQVDQGGGYWYQVFERGVIYSSPRGTFAVDDSRIDALHRSLGGGGGSLGYPVGATRTVGTERAQTFERGTIQTSGTSARVL